MRIALLVRDAEKKASIRWQETRRQFQFQFQYLCISRVHLFYDIQWERIHGIPFTKNENLLFTMSGRKHQIRNNKIQKNIDKTTLTV